MIYELKNKSNLFNLKRVDFKNEREMQIMIEQNITKVLFEGEEWHTKQNSN